MSHAIIQIKKRTLNYPIARINWKEIKRRIGMQWIQFISYMNNVEDAKEEFNDAFRKKEEARKFLNAFLNEHRRDE